MTPPTVAFDPGAELTMGALDAITREPRVYLTEAVLQRLEDDRLCLTIQGDAGEEIFTIYLRPDFLDDALAQARAREEDAA